MATPPALDAFPGEYSILASWNTAIASGVEGMLAPSATQGLGIFLADFVLGCAGECDVAGDAPRTHAGVILGVGILLHILLDTAAAYVLELLDVGYLLLIETFGIVDKTVGVGEGDDLGPQAHGLFGGVLGNVTCTGNYYGLPIETLALCGEHLLGKVAQAVTGGFGTEDGSSPGEALAGKGSGEFVAKPLVLAEEVADFAAAHADIACRDVGVLPDMLAKFGHETLAETHDFGI